MERAITRYPKFHERFFSAIFFLIICAFCGCSSKLTPQTVSILKDQYNPKFLDFLHFLYGKGYLAEGATESNKLLISGLDLKHSKILDFGCGTGGVSQFISNTFQDSQIVGIDVVPECIRLAKSNFPKKLHPNLDFLAYQSYKLPFPDHSFDFVFAKEVFIHILDKEATLSEIHRILKPNGQFILLDWLACFKDCSNSSSVDQVIHLASAESLEAYLGVVGFKKIKRSNFTDAYKIFLKHTLEKLNQKSNDPLAKDYAESLSKLLNNLNNQNVVVLRLHYLKPPA